MKEKRITCQLEEFWKKNKPARKLPSSTLISAKNLDSVWDSCSVFDVKHGGKTPSLKLTHLGMDFVNTYGMTLRSSGYHAFQLLCENYKTVHPEVAARAIESKGIITDDEETLTENGDFLVKWRLGAYPFVDQEQQIDKVLIGMRWMAVTEKKSNIFTL